MKNLAPFISHIQSECDSHGIRLVLSPNQYVDGCRGWFSHDCRRLVVAMDNPLSIWLPTLLHEYGHLEQWSQNSPYYNDAKMGVSDWLKMLKKHASTIDRIRDLELDCERRSYRNITTFNLPLEKREYVRRAASYVHFYNYLKLNPKWYRKPPYEIPEIMDRMPKTLRGDFKELKPAQEEIYRRYYD